RRHSAHLAQTHFRHHPLKARANDHARRGPTEVLVHDVDLLPTQLMQSLLHRILQPLALQVVVDLVGRRLTHVQDRLSSQMLRFHLVTHRAPPGPGRLPPSDRLRAAATGPATRSSSLACPAGASEMTDARGVLERDWVAHVAWGSQTAASAPPVSTTEECRASLSSSVADPRAVRRTACAASKASQSTVGATVSRSDPHAASNIQVGISRDRRLRSSSRPHRQTACPPLVSTSYTVTARPHHGCQG